jgi:hypothetical protein
LVSTLKAPNGLTGPELDPVSTVASSAAPLSLSAPDELPLELLSGGDPEELDELPPPEELLDDEEAPADASESPCA